VVVVFTIAGGVFTFVPRITYGYGMFAIPPFLGVIAGITGAIAAGIATCTWDESGVPDVTVAKSRPVQVGLRYIHVYRGRICVR